MRSYMVSGMLMGFVGVAISVASASPTDGPRDSVPTQPRPVAVQRVSLPASGGVRDELAMVLVGTALIGLAAAVRRAA